jgi:hypothetical protein
MKNKGAIFPLYLWKFDNYDIDVVNTFFMRLLKHMGVVKGLKKITLVVVLLLVTGFAKAQNYDVINHRVDSLVNLGLPKSALAEVQKLEVLARKNKSAPQQIQAVLYRMTLQSYLEENALTGIIDSLRNDIDHSAYPVKPVLQSLLGSMYYNYY